MASHLREELARLVPLDNPPFEPLSLELVALESQLDRDPQGGLARLREFKQAARKSLPPNLEQQIAGKALVVIMGRRTSQKGHDVAVAAIRRLFLANPTFPAFFFFATTGGDETSPVRLERIVGLCREFPSRCAYSDGRLSYFNQLMAAADFNCMPSLGEPHGGAFQSSVIPIARGIDGLAAQICPLEPVGEAVRLRDLFHPAGALPSGFTFREDPLADSGRSANEVRDILVNPTPAPHNETLARMTVALARVVKQAVSIHATEPGRYARLVQGALRAQMVRTWEMNLGGVLALVDAARV
jgi:glycosyltransferase involved in cell wall biosynthesis